MRSLDLFVGRLSINDNKWLPTGGEAIKHHSHILHCIFEDAEINAHDFEL